MADAPTAAELIRRERDARWRAHRDRAARQALADLAALQLTRCRVDTAVQFELAERTGLTAFGAA